MRQRLGVEVVACLIQDYRAGWSLKLLGERYGISKHWVLKLLAEEGVATRKLLSAFLTPLKGPFV